MSKYVKRQELSEQIIRDKDARPMTRNRLRNDTCFLSMKEPKSVKDALEDKKVISTKLVYIRKLDENSKVTRNKARLVCKGYAQEEWIDYGETFISVARLEGVRTLLVFSTCKGFKVY